VFCDLREGINLILKRIGHFIWMPFLGIAHLRSQEESGQLREMKTYKKQNGKEGAEKGFLLVLKRSILGTI